MKALAEHFFRHEYGRLVAALSRRVGVQHLAAVEDAVQLALSTALEAWRGQPPENPSAWLYRVALNQVVAELRSARRHTALLESSAAATVLEAPEARLRGEVGEDLLRLLFVCCDDALPVEAQLALALKVLCGFSVAEIAARLFVTEANVYQRVGRAQRRLEALDVMLDEPGHEALAARLPAVHLILYVLFTEGHLSSNPDGALRRELCDEAVRLATVLANHPLATPETFALLALMHLHLARMPARLDETGLQLLDEQDRSLWDADEVARGLEWLARSATGESFSRYHAEAGIAAEHCLAPSFEATRWERIVACYELLERQAPSVLHTLNRALAIAEWKGPEAALEVLAGRAPPSWLEGSWQWLAVFADLHRRAGHGSRATEFREAALAAAPSVAVREALTRRLSR